MADARRQRALPLYLAAALLVLSACRTAPGPGKQPATATPAPVTGSVLYSVDDAASQVLVLAYREGPMAALGHNHVIAVRELHGSVQLHDDVARSLVELQFPVSAMSVDEPALRAAAGADFTSVVSDSARDGTRSNMLGERLLQAAGNPTITLDSERLVATDGGWLMTTRIGVRGRDAHVDIPLQLQRDGDQLTASGEFTVLQSALGLAPYSVMMGALRVKDEIRVRFRVVATRVHL